MAAARLATASPQPLTHRLPAILCAAATRLEQMNPDASMSEHARHREIQVSVWDHHGIYNNAVVGRDITAVLASIRDVPLAGTRAAYADRLRATARTVTR
ncbi:hypothetical protein [Streptomyces californicus]|uniref:hypothetical protein n=1 Tax=Streptomyces californicus TaxID=67351 RepID=UPI0036AEC29B